MHYIVATYFCLRRPTLKYNTLAYVRIFQKIEYVGLRYVSSRLELGAVADENFGGGFLVGVGAGDTRLQEVQQHFGKLYFEKLYFGKLHFSKLGLHCK